MVPEQESPRSAQAAPGSVRRLRAVAVDADAPLDWLSWLRVVAICGVVAIHTSGATAVLDGAGSSATGLLAIALNRGFNFTVPVFVMISGALLLDPSRYRGDAAFLRHRAVRLIPAIVVWHLFYWGFRVLYLDQTLSWRDALVATITGKMFTALYYFWIVLGLVLVTPLLSAWVARASRRSVLVAGAAATAIPILTVATFWQRKTPVVWVELPWTWWVPYLGLYLLGWGLRGVVLRGWAVLSCTGMAMFLAAVIAYQFRHPSPELGAFVGGYYGLVGQSYGVVVFLLAPALVRRDGLLRGLCRPALSRVARLLGDATLGVFALHAAVLTVSYRLPLLGGSPAASTLVELVGRVAFVIFVTYGIVLVGRRAPLVRRLF